MSLATVSGVPGSRRKTPLRTLQVDDSPWHDFDENTRRAGTTRPDALRAFIKWFNREPGAKLPRRPDAITRQPSSPPSSEPAP